MVRGAKRATRTLAAMADLPVPGGPCSKHEIMLVRELLRNCQGAAGSERV